MFLKKNSQIEKIQKGKDIQQILKENLVNVKIIGKYLMTFFVVAVEKN